MCRVSWLLLPMLLVVLVLALVPSLVSGQGETPRFLPQEQLLAEFVKSQGLELERFPVDPAGWDEAAGYTVPDEQGRVIYTVVMYASLLRSPEEAREVYLARTRQLELDNESTHAWNTPRAEAMGMDDSRDFRLVYMDITSRSRSSEYARLLRKGAAISLIEVVGSPEPDDEGMIDETRLSIMMMATRLVAGRLLDTPTLPPNTAYDGRLRLPLLGGVHPLHGVFDFMVSPLGESTTRNRLGVLNLA